MFKPGPGACSFAVVPKNRVFRGACAAIMEEGRKVLERHSITQAPQGRGAPLARNLFPGDGLVRKTVAEVVETQIGIRRDDRGNFLSVGIGQSNGQSRFVAGSTTEVREGVRVLVGNGMRCW